MQESIYLGGLKGLKNSAVIKAKINTIDNVNSVKTLITECFHYNRDENS